MTMELIMLMKKHNTWFSTGLTSAEYSSEIILTNFVFPVGAFLFNCERSLILDYKSRGKHLALTLAIKEKIQLVGECVKMRYCND